VRIENRRVFRADGFGNPLLHLNSAASAAGFFFEGLTAISYISNSHNNTLSVAGMRVHDPDCSPSGIQDCDLAQTRPLRFFRLSAMFSSNSRDACAACGGFGLARNTPAAFDVFYWLQVTNFSLLKSAPNGVYYIDIRRLFLHDLFRLPD